ncbi:MAG: HAD-IIB family hydrolase, partial [Erysipelotrichaceae bacterium]|nr:HAD-IIB family hydrolase [Erysipelotrichaceae bacterium]
MIQWIAMDLDGTLTNHQKKITKKTIEALIEAQKQGVRLLLISGRIYEGMVNEAKQLQMDQYHGLIVSHNGAKVTDFQTKEVLFEKRLAKSLALELLHDLENMPIYPIIDGNGTLWVRSEKTHRLQIETRVLHTPYRCVDSWEQVLQKGPYKILLSARPRVFEKRIAPILEKYQNQMKMAFSTPFYLEVTALEVGKKEALENLSQMFQVPMSNIMAFGDGL